jgi:hypothetical protein
LKNRIEGNITIPNKGGNNLKNLLRRNLLIEKPELNLNSDNSVKVITYPLITKKNVTPVVPEITLKPAWPKTTISAEMALNPSISEERPVAFGSPTLVNS